MMSSFRDRPHATINGNNADPDAAKSWSCSACRLPIFFTPYISCNTDKDDGAGGSTQVFLHEQCADLPKELKDCDLHPQKPLLLGENEQTSTKTCFACLAKCGTKLYYCPDPNCGFQLDVACALAVKILHWSHKHRLVAIRAGSKLSSLLCGVCGNKHEVSTRSARSYYCSACSFWIHPDCASLPDAIEFISEEQHRHGHPLVLSYDSRAPFGPKSSTAISSVSMRLAGYSTKGHQDHFSCAICGDQIESFGMYFCIKCDYYVHITCAGSNSSIFKRVLIRKAQIPDLVRLPIPDEYRSLIHYVTDSSKSGGGRDDGVLQEHRLKFHESDDINLHDDPRICDGCVKFISPPFYSCPECPDFFLHYCCVDLPLILSSHPAHPVGRPLFLNSDTDIRHFSPDYTFICGHCKRPSNAFSYWCESMNFQMDVSCALMPASITHSAHSEGHILHLLDFATGTQGRCDCCGESLEALGYECWICHNFALHTWCAMLPIIVTHKFDQHPLKLITTTSTNWSSSESSSGDIHHDTVVYSSASQKAQIKPLCEICENDINEPWYYSCDECDQSLHINCISSLDELSNIKFGSSTGSRVPTFRCHGSPLSLIRGLTLRGSRCDCCRETFNNNDMLAFECSKCYLRIHLKCAKKYK